MDKKALLFSVNLKSLSLLLVLTAALVSAASASEKQTRVSTDESPAPDKEVIQCLRKGHDALDKKDLDEATKLFQACVAQHPKSGLAHYWLGQSYLFAHKSDVAESEIKEALRLDPGNLYAVHALGRLYSLDKNKLDLAEELLAKVLSMDPHFEDARFDLARVYAQRGKLDLAFPLFSQIFKQEIKFAAYHTEFGRLLTALGQEKGAKEQYQRALTLFPNYEPAKKLLQALENKQQGKEDARKEAPSSEKKANEPPTRQ